MSVLLDTIKDCHNVTVVNYVSTNHQFMEALT